MADTPKRGRPSAADRRTELIEQVFDRHANGEPLPTICEALGVPPAEFRGWMRKAPATVQAEWKLAKEEYVHSIFDEMAQITKRLASNKYTKEDGAKVQALRAALDGLKHITSRLNPGQYGEQKAGAQGITVIINSSLPLGGNGGSPEKTIDGDFKVVVPLEGPRGE